MCKQIGLNLFNGKIIYMKKMTDVKLWLFIAVLETIFKQKKKKKKKKIMSSGLFKNDIYKMYLQIIFVQSAGAVEYTDCTSAEG